MLEYTYPRLDVEVSKKLNHLLKSPFVVHPGTGRVCVPIDISKADVFDPLGVPTVTQLLGEIDAWEKEKENEKSTDEMVDDNANGVDSKKKLQDYEKTSLKPYVDYFRAFVTELMRSENRQGKRGRNDDQEEEEEKKNMMRMIRWSFD